MTDLMFLLLIFMIIATTLINPNALKLMLPKSANQLKDKAVTTVSIQQKYGSSAGVYFSWLAQSYSAMTMARNGS